MAAYIHIPQEFCCVKGHILLCSMSKWHRCHSGIGGEFMSDRKTAVSVATHHLSRLASEGRIKIGECLPTERQLARDLGVSRQSIREAINQLAANGILKRTRRVGTMIAAEIAMFGCASPGQAAQAHIAEACLALEPYIASLAAQRASREQLAAMAAALRKMSHAVDDINAFHRHDLDFHRILAAACANPVLSSIMAGCGCHLPSCACPGGLVEALKTLAESHRKLYRAVRAGNAITAQSLTKTLTCVSPARPAREESRKPAIARTGRQTEKRLAPAAFPVWRERAMPLSLATMPLPREAFKIPLS